MPRPTPVVARAAPPSFPPGTAVWVPCSNEVWQQAEIVGIRDGTLYAIVDGVEVGLDQNQPVFVANVETMSEGGLTSHDDLTQLSHLHEASVLHSLNVRFDIDKIYTFTGPILIAVNPFKRILGLYTQEALMSFIDNPPQSVESRVPHVFSTAIVAYRGLCCRRACQTILISGESGAGKTESTKFVMQLLAVAGSTDRTNPSQIENQVLQSNPLLEAFGNAKTLRNDNSSRFGKFIEMQFQLESHGGEDKGRLAGARIHTYLLETVRVCHQLEGERNYHVFYQACAAASSKKCKNGRFPMPTSKSSAESEPQRFVDLLRLSSHEHFHYLTQSSCSTLTRVDDVEEFETTLGAMETVGLPHDEISDVISVIGAVLFVGNLSFKTPEGQSEASCVAAVSTEHLKVAAEFLGLEANILEAALCFRTIRMKSEVFRKPLKVREAEDTRDALARALYNTMFLKIVKRTNASIGYRDDVSLFCGVLDIFGFECFEYNSFEQLCINFTNERLQQFFNNFIFKLEEELYKKEKISWDPLDFPDNQDCVDILQGKPAGIFAMLDEECLVPQGSDKGFCNKLKERHKNHRRFGVIKTKADWFTVNHFAGPVHYCSDGFLDKNKDQLSQDVQDAIKGSEKAFVNNLFEEFLDRGFAETKKKQLVTVSSEFRQQLAYLMLTVHRTEPHFIRCIKPNPRNKPDIFDRKGVTEQLRYGGVLQAVQVSRAGYPIRLKNLEVVKDYRILLPLLERKKLTSDSSKSSVEARAILEYLDTALKIPTPKHAAQSWAIGQTMSFFKHEAFEILSSARASTLNAAATKIKANWKRVTQRASFLHFRLCVVIIQAAIRGFLARRLFLRLRKERAILTLQASARCRVVRLRFLEHRQAVGVVQRLWRGYLARRRVHELQRNLAALEIQRIWRGRRVAARRRAQIRAALTIQCWRRQILAKRELRRLRLNARNTVLLQHDKESLQSELRDLRTENARLVELVLKLEGVVAERDEEIIKLSTRVKELEKFSIQDTPPHQKDDLNFSTPPNTTETPSSAASSSVVLLTPASPVLSLVPVVGDESGEIHILVPAPVPSEPNIPHSEVSTDTADLSPQSHRSKGRTETPCAKQNAELRELRSVVTSADGELQKTQEAVRRKDSELHVIQGQLAARDEEVTRLMKAHQESANQLRKVVSSSTREKQKIDALESEIEILKKKLAQDGLKKVSGSPTADTHPVVPFFDPTKRFDVVLVGLSSYDLMSATAKECGDEVVPATSCFLNVPTSEGVVQMHISDATGGSLPESAVRELASRAKNLVAVCNASCLESTKQAIQALKMADMTKYIFVTNHAEIDLTEINEAATRLSATVFTGENSLCPLLSSLAKPKVASRSPPSKPTSLMKNIITFFGGEKSTTGGRGQNVMFLRPSQAGTLPLASASKQSGATTPPSDILPVQEVHDVDSAITYVIFGQQRRHRNYSLLAAGAKDGSVLVYRCYRTAMEMKMVHENGATVSELDERYNSNAFASQPSVAVHTKMVGHSKAITSIFFSDSEENLVTTSIDRSVRFWSVENGDMLKVFSDSSPALVAAQMPFDSNFFIAANANAVLRLVSVQNGSVVKKLKFESEVRTLRFDKNGINCFAGCKNGVIHVLECPDSSDIKLRQKFPLTKVAITDITFIPPRQDCSASLAVNSCDSTLSIVDVTYANNGSSVSTLAVKCRLKIAQSLLPLRSAYSSWGGSWIVSASEDREVYVWSLQKLAGSGHCKQPMLLEHHTAPILTVAVNDLNTVLVSADTCGKIVLWRRIDFSACKHES